MKKTKTKQNTTKQNKNQNKTSLFLEKLGNLMRAIQDFFLLLALGRPTRPTSCTMESLMNFLRLYC